MSTGTTSPDARRVVVYTHRDVEPWLARLEGERIHRGEALEIYAVDRPLVAELVSRLEGEWSLICRCRGAICMCLWLTTLSGTVEARRLMR